MALNLSEEVLYDAINYRLPHYHQDIPFILVWSHKSGCTSTLQWFFWHTGDLAAAQSYENKTVMALHSYEAKVFKANLYYRYDLAEAIMAERPLINFLRCPFERVWSSYLHIHNRHFISLEKENKENHGLSFRKEVQRFVYGQDVSIEYPFSFWDYLSYLDQQGLEDIDRHHSSQYTPLFDLPTLRHYRLEDFEDVASTLEQEFGLEDSLEARKTFRTSHHVNKEALDPKVTIGLLKRGLPLTYSPQFKLPKVNRKLLQGTEFEALIAKLFAKDLALYDAIA